MNRLILGSRAPLFLERGDQSACLHLFHDRSRLQDYHKMKKIGTIMVKGPATRCHPNEKSDDAAFDACPVAKMNGFLCQVD